MRTFIFIFLLVIVHTSCSEVGDQLGQNEPIPSNDEEDIVQYFDSLNNKNPKRIDTLPKLLDRSVSWLKKPLNYDTLMEKVSKDEYPLTKVDSYHYPFDSLVKTQKDYKDPIVQPVIVRDHQITEPKRVKILSPRQRDNSVIDVQCIGPSEGLPTETVTDILIDSRGLFWLTSPNGLIRYDGSHIKHYTRAEGLPDDALICLEEDSEGNIWMGSENNGVIKYDGTQFQHFRFDSILPNRKISDITFDHDGNLWCTVVFGGILKIEGNEYTLYNRRQGVIDTRPLTHIEVDKNNQVFASGFGIGMYSVKNDSLYLYPRPLTTYNHSLLTNDDGSILIAPFARHLSELKNDSLFHYHFDLKPDYGFLAPVKDADGNYWMSPVDKGLVKWDGKKLKHYSKENGFPSNSISCITRKGKNLWIGTTDQGFFKFSPSSFKFLTEKEGLPDRLVHEISEGKDGQYYFGTAGGFVELNDSVRTTFKNKIFLKQGSKKTYYGSGFYNEFTLNGLVMDFDADTSGRLVLITVNKGVLYLDRNKGEISLLGSNISNGPANPSSITRTADGTLWISSSAGGHFYKIENDSMKWYGIQQNMYARNINHLITNHNDKVCMGTENYGVVIMNDQETFTYYNRENGLPSVNVKYLYEDSKKTLWACTSKGLAYKRKDQSEFEKANLPDDIPSEDISAIIQDDKQRYWVTTTDGLLMVKFDQNYETEYHELFTKNKGLINTSFIPTSIYIDSKNQLMAGTYGGLMVFGLNEYEYQLDTPEVFLENVEINGKFISFRDQQNFQYEGVSGFFNTPERLMLDHTENYIVFNLSNKISNHLEKINYEYKLEGFDQQWTQTQESEFAEYKNLGYGKYVFKFRSILPNGVKSDIKTFEFEITRPWWHTWWARLLYAVLVLMIILTLIKWRTFKLKQRQKELEEEVDKATSEIRQQKDTIEVAHNEIRDSINYARRIQSAILPPQKVVKEYLNNSFILYKPKDVVAGDFYWMQILETEETNTQQILIAAADCTGHGVPGAMVSVVCNNSLNRSVREFGLKTPGEILNKTRELVIQEFEKSEEEVKDGMDIALLSLTPKFSEGIEHSEVWDVRFAGAHNPLWIVRKEEELEDESALVENGYGLIEIKADKQPIGKFDDLKPYTTHEIKMKPGDTLYLFSDGYADQFGGEEMAVHKRGGKKFKSKNFKKLLLSYQHLNMEEQRETLEKAFEQWRGDMEQVDDVCVIGVRL